MMTRGRAALAVAALLLAGCSGSDGGDGGIEELPAGEIVTATRAAAVAAPSVRVAGDIVEDDEPVALDMTYATNGAAGSVTTEGYTIELLRVDDAAYIKADEETWNGIGGDPAAAELLADRYVKIPPDSSDFEALVPYLSWQTFVDDVFAEIHTVEKGAVQDINGTPAIGLVQDGPVGGTAWVALEGDPYPLRIEGPAGSAAGAIDFSGWGQPVELTRPAGADVVDLSEVFG